MASEFNTSEYNSDFSDSSSGSVTAQFSVDNVCGVGGACVVYRMNLDGLRVAVKRLNEKYRGQPAFVASYLKEFALGRNLKHDALPVYRELYVAEDEVYIVMDYVDGISIHDFIRSEEGKEYFSSADNVRRFFSELVNVVGYLHRSGVIHCDLKASNIMLRHSDRSVMLIDLDKAYSDTLNTTHGGSITMSNPLSEGEKVSAAKDINAIGRVYDIIAESVPQFPARKFRRFRKACDYKDISADKLQSELQARSHGRLWVTSILCIVVLTVICIISIFKEDNTAISIEYHRITNDTPVIEHAPIPTSTQPLPESESRATIDIDFDGEMNAFTQEAENALSRLSHGSLSDEQMSDLMLQLVENYTIAYNQVVTSAKTENTQMSAIDVELAIARKAENSNALRVLQQFTKAAADSLTARSQD